MSVVRQVGSGGEQLTGSIVPGVFDGVQMASSPLTTLYTAPARTEIKTPVLPPPGGTSGPWTPPLCRKPFQHLRRPGALLRAGGDGDPLRPHEASLLGWSPGQVWIPEPGGAAAGPRGTRHQDTHEAHSASAPQRKDLGETPQCSYSRRGGPHGLLSWPQMHGEGSICHSTV